MEQKDGKMDEQTDEQAKYVMRIMCPFMWPNTPG